MIEFLWIEDYEEVQNERTKPMQLFERLSTATDEVSPFGICFRPSNNFDTNAPFPVWKYNPIYLPNHLSIEVGSETPLNEPMWFYISFATRPDSFPSEKMQPIHHKIPLKEVTSAILTMKKNDNISEPAMIVNRIPNFKVIEAEEHLLELEFDNCIEGKMHDFRPILPLIFRW
jgi:hypothetical protein